MQTLKEFNPAAHGLRVAGTPITRKPRTPSSKSAPKPKYADAVWFSFQQAEPLELEVRLASVEDTIRKLKQAARYLDRTHGPKTEVRVQISVEPVLEPLLKDGEIVYGDDGKIVMVPVKPAKSVVKFLGHAPYLLGRRVSMAAATGGPAPDEDGRPDLRHVAKQEYPELAPGQHRKRTVAGPAHRKSALRRAVVRAVITPEALSFPPVGEPRASVFSRLVHPWFPGCQAGCRTVRIPIDFSHLPCLTRGVHDRR